MNSLQAIRHACIDALGEANRTTDWQDAYCAVVDPESILELTENLESLLAHADRTDPTFALMIRSSLRLPAVSQRNAAWLPVLHP